ncbi:MAG: nucleotide exchange factor GrpE [Aeromonadales bacterium]|nr:nucleotide exchange factor GrpE [Aeromonadales bacterium]
MQTEETQMQESFYKANAQNEDVTNATSPTETLNQPEADECACANDEDQQEDIAFDAKEVMAENEQLKAQLESVQAQAKEDKEKLVRALAECENQKKRIEADVERERKFGNEKILKALIPVVDSLDLALKHSDPNNEAAKPTIEGVQNTVTLLVKELGNFGIQGIDPKGELFDPNLHQAISMVPSPFVEANHVMDVMQKGYVLNGRVVRPAMVIVSSGAPAQSTDTQENKENSINIEA